MTKKGRVLVLDKIRYSDSDLIITTLNAYGGKQSFFAPCALKSKRRFAGGVLDKGNFIEALYTAKPNNNLLRLKDAVLIKSFDGIRQSFDKMSLAVDMLKLVKMYAQEGVVDNFGLFNLLGNSFQTLENCQNLELFRLTFEVKFWHIQGLLPSEQLFSTFLSMPILSHASISLSSAELEQTNLLLESVRKKCVSL